ncbi:ABC transporter G family member 38, partial [Frankliniella fusca]
NVFGHLSLWRQQTKSRGPLFNVRTELQCLNVQPELHDFDYLEPSQPTPEDCSDELIYPGARISVQESVLSCIVFAQTENLKTAALCRLLGLIDIHCPKENKIPNSTHLFFKNLNKANSAFTVTYYCNLCWKDRSSSSDFCETCESPKKRVHCYVSCDINQQIAALYQRPDFVKAIQHKSNRTKINVNNIEDIYDGCIYKEAQRTVLTDPYNIFLMWYTDGIQLYESSTYSLWPFYFVVNELPLHLRFRPENIIIAGFWGSSTHPHPNIFLRETLGNIKKIKQGIDVDIFGLNEKSTIKVFVLCGVGDSPAKACFMNIISHSGFFACPKCLIEGENSKQIGNVTVFPFQEILHTRPSTMSQEYKNQVKESMKTLNDCQGVKGPILLSYMLQDTCMFESTAIDGMHSVYMGCIKQILNLITNSKFFKLPFSISKHRLPVQIDKPYLWKASLLRNFFFYIMLPLLKIFMSDLYFEHLTLLVEANFYLNRPSISMSDITKAEDLLRQLVKEFEMLYGPPTCYGFEDLNGKLGNLAHGTKDSSMQIAKRYCTSKWKRFHIEEAISSTLCVVGYYDKTLQQFNEFSHILSIFYSVPYSCKTFCKLFKDQQLYVAATEKRSARNSSFVKYSCRDGNVLGEISTFVKVSTSLNDEHYFACCKRRAVQSILPDGRLGFISKGMGEVCTDLVPVHNIVTVLK